jgi:hypothetical protein
VTFEIKRYDGERPIIQLPIFPLAFDPDFTAIRDKFITRGNTWLQLSRANQSTHKHYKGCMYWFRSCCRRETQLTILMRI